MTEINAGDVQDLLLHPRSSVVVVAECESKVPSSGQHASGLLI